MLLFRRPKSGWITILVVTAVALLSNYVGQTQASKRVEVNPRVDGFLKDIGFVEGSLVAERTTLYRIDASPFEAALDRNKALGGGWEPDSVRGEEQ